MFIHSIKQALIALLITFLTLYLGESITDPSAETFTPLYFNLNKYGETSVFYGSDTTDSDIREMQRHYDKLVLAQNGDPKKVASVSDGK